MQETVFYMRGAFPFSGDLALFAPPVTTDLKSVLGLNDEQVKNLDRDLAEYAGFLDRPTISRIANQYTGDEQKSQSIARLIHDLHRRLNASGKSVQDLLTYLDSPTIDSSAPEARPFSPDELGKLRRHLPLLTRRYPGLVRQAKAQNLASVTGVPLDDIRLVCDLRPVFDDQHTIVHGAFPRTTLRLTYKDAAGLPVSLDVGLSESQVADLAQKAQEAQKKITVLKQTMDAKGLLVPITDATDKGE